MRKIILTLMVFGAGLSAIAQNTYGLDDGNTRATKRQKAMSAWHKDMADFRARSMEERQLNDLADSLASELGILSKADPVDICTFQKTQRAFPAV